MILKKRLKEVIELQRKNLESSELGIVRDYNIELEHSFAKIISGIRRCGKSTFLNQLLRKEKVAYYLNLEDPRLNTFELEDFNKIEEIMYELYGSNGSFFFDEIQVVDKWEKYIRYLVDKKSKVVLTGSNASLLSKELGTKLTGRYLKKEIFPFSYLEFLKLKNLESNIDSFFEYFFTGGFPEFIKTKNSEILNELLSDIVLKDVVVRYKLKNVDLIKKLALYLISNVSKEFSYNSLKKTFQVPSVQTIIDYINYLENTYMIFSISCFSYSYKKQLISPKKVYSIDNGFSNINSISFSKDKGRMLENMVFLNLRKKHKEIFYNKQTHECDFVIKQGLNIIDAIQVCYELTEENKKREISGLVEAMKEFKLKQGLILTYNDEDEIIIDNKKILIKPVWKWLLE